MNSTDASSLSGLHILLVDDNPLNLLVARTILEGMGTRVSCAGDGQQALDLLREGLLVDLALMDIQMPVMDGYQATRLIRTELGLTIPVLAVSAGMTPEELELCRRAGMDDFVAKPIEVEALLATIARHVAGRTATPMPGLTAVAGVFDITRLLALSEGKPAQRAALAGLIERLVSRARSDVQAAYDAQLAGDPITANAALHSLRGAVGTFGATRFVAQCLQLEQAIRARDAHAITSLFDGVQREIGLLIDAATAWLATQQAAPAAPAPPAPAPAQSTVLIIDDNATIIGQLSLIIQDQARVLFATNGREGLDMARQHLPDIILLDVEVANMDGFEVCRQIRSDSALAKCAIIFITGHASTDVEVACLDAGAVDFLPKPLIVPIVQARVRTHLRLQSALKALENLSIRDGLTGLYNRRHVDAQLATEFSRHRRHDKVLGLALIDVDHFKQYNDHYGHQLGDMCLQQVAQALENSVKRPGDFVARYGGEEFVVVLPNTDDEGVRGYAARVCALIAALELPHAASPVCRHVTVSVGLCSMQVRGNRSVQELVACADRALYQAKKDGRNRYHLDQPDPPGDGPL